MPPQAYDAHMYGTRVRVRIMSSRHTGPPPNIPTLGVTCTTFPRTRRHCATAYAGRMANKLVIKVTAGADAPERCSQAFTVAAVAVASGVDVSL
jgi:hypothetical protein